MTLANAEVAESTEIHPEIKSVLASSITFASQQNDVPVIRDISIVNESDITYENLDLSFTASPEFVSSKVWKIDRLLPRSTLRISDTDLLLSGQYLYQLNESISGEAVLTLRNAQHILAEDRHSLRVLARNEWGGIGTMADLVAAFSMPNDPAIEKILKGAATTLLRAGKPSAIDGYKSGSRTRVWEIVSGIWSAVADLGLDYALPPASFENQGQKIRSPSQILDSGLGTCLDLALLFAACFEQAGLNPFIIMTKGHAFVGVWLQPEQFASLTVDSASTIRKRLVLNELLVFETTLITQKPSLAFSKAVDEGKRQLSEEEESNFEIAIDLRRARMQKIRPLTSSSEKPLISGNTSPEPIVSGFEEAPTLPNFQGETLISDQMVDTPQTRLENWQRQLLDLSLRNPLLNFRANSSSLKLVCPDPGFLEDRLADGHKIKIVSQPDICDGQGQRSSAVHLARDGEKLDEVYAREALERYEVLAKLDPKDLDARLTSLYRTARKDLEEGGANTLYVALGFLTWEKKEDDERKFRAPLVLIPVALERKSVRGGVRMVLGEDEPRFNTTLLQMLRQDFDLEIKGLDSTLPQDEHGVDIGNVWKIVREAVKEQRGFEVVEDVVLGIFSFSKYLMWKDLTDRADLLKNSPVVKHLIETPRETYGNGTAFPDVRSLDSKCPPDRVFTPLPADSSQLAAVMACASGKDFVLIGPPGTGKSQTIANMISQNLAQGRRVLFVAEKITALNVVYRRLTKLGLGDFCLQLHSNKAKKTDILEQLRKAWTLTGPAPSGEWSRQATRLKKVRDELNEYVTRIHKVFPNGLSPYVAMGRAIANDDLPIAKLSWPTPEHHTRDDLEKLCDLVERLAENYGPIAEISNTGLGVIRNENWSPAWARQLLHAMVVLNETAKDIERHALSLRTLLGKGDTELSEIELASLSTIVSALLESHGKDMAFVFNPDAAMVLERGGAALDILAKYNDAEARLSTSYCELAWKNIDLDTLSSEYDAANKKPVILSFFTKLGIRQILRKKAGAKGKVDIDNDLRVLHQLKELGQRFETYSESCKSLPDCHGYKSDVDGLKKLIALGRTMRRAMAEYAMDSNELQNVHASVKQLVTGMNELLESGSKIGADCEAYLDSYAKHSAAVQAFDALTLSKLNEWLKGKSYLTNLVSLLSDIQDQSARLNAWCAWQRARTEAYAQGLGSLVALLEGGAIPLGSLKATFEKSYSRWWSDAVVDADPVLQSFVPVEHERRIKTFNDLDEQFLDLTAKYVRAKLSSELPSEEDAKRGTELGTLRRELEKKRAHKALRQLIAEMPEYLTRITPCLLMSPLSIAQYLSPEHAPFDVVIFDEASQITVWDAIGAISRGKSVVVVGDPQQLPPTSFFNRQDSQEPTDDDAEQDLSSILDECLGAGLPRLELNWHYRSRSENLITFSNHRFYNGELVTFPSPMTNDRAVRLIAVPEGVYDRGGSKTNRGEASAIVNDVVKRLRDPNFLATGQSIGIVTFNGEQQRLIEDLLDAERNKDPRLDKFFDDTQIDEPVFVKNLERVQGDERDVMLFSITYGPDKTGVVSMNFGPLNQTGGPRRLNVAITRARNEMVVFSTLKADQIDLSKTSAIGVKDLKHFLEFAERGPKALAQSVEGSVGTYESCFEESVAKKLSERGWRVVPQIGVSKFRIDLGVVHPDAPGRFLAGIECDGATYHRSATARDRDKLREQVLRNLGWEINRIWSTDWWIDPQNALDKLHLKLTEQLESSRKTNVAVSS